MLVRKNYADVLRQLAYFQTGDYYWIDSICIDQDNVREKSDQVAMMGMTFKQAAGVMSCIGLHNPSSRFLVEKLREFE
jgi:hypothetical protein